MTRHHSRRLELKRETLQRLADGELGRVAGGWIARCTYEKSGCVGQCYTGSNNDCDGGGTGDCGGEYPY